MCKNKKTELDEQPNIHFGFNAGTAASVLG